MAEIMIMPSLSLNDEQNLLAAWYVKEGDTVNVGDKLFSIETDKSAMDVEAEVSGTVLALYYEEDSDVDVRTPVMLIGEAGEKVLTLEEAQQKIGGTETAAAKEEVQRGEHRAGTTSLTVARPVIMPSLSLNDEQNLLASWYVNEGDTVHIGDKLFSIETDKSSMDVEAETEGTLLKKYYDEDDDVDVRTVVALIGDPGDVIPELDAINAAICGESDAESKEEAAAGNGGKETLPETAQAEKKDKADASGKKGQPVYELPPVQTLNGKAAISPRARKLAIENNINWNVIRPSGAENRILEEDVRRYMQTGKAEVRVATGAARTMKLPKIRQAIASNMMHSLQSTAQLTLNSLFNATGVQNLRERFKSAGGEMKGVTIGDLVLFAVTRTLSEFPYMNAWMVSDNEVVEFDDVNLGVAVDTERGLMVPTIMGANAKSLLEISGEMKALAGECRQGSISPDKMKNASFTISNVGSYGIRTFTPVINPPQVAILGVGCIDYMAKKTKDGMLFYPAMYLSLTIDHRYIDGGPGARFLKKLCENLENIETLIEE